MAKFILLVISVLVPSIFILGYILHLITRLFKIQNANYKTALKIIGLFSIISLIWAGIIDVIPFFEILAPIFSFISFYLIFKKYYPIKLKAGFFIFIVFTILSLIVSLIIVVSIRSFVFQPFSIIGKAMEPTLKAGDYTSIKMYNRNFGRGDIIVFKYPLNHKEYYIKRIVGLPGETVIIKDGKVYIKNNNKPEGFILDESSYTDKYTSKDTELMLKNDEYFVLGDNRDASSDSRAWGAVKKDLIVGKYWFTAFSLK